MLAGDVAVQLPRAGGRPGAVDLGGVREPGADVQQHGVAARLDQRAVERQVRQRPLLVAPRLVAGQQHRLHREPVVGGEHLGLPGDAAAFDGQP